MHVQLPNRPSSSPPWEGGFSPRLRAYHLLSFFPPSNSHARLLELTNCLSSPTCRLPATHLHLLCWRLTQTLPAESPHRAERKCVAGPRGTEQASACVRKEGTCGYRQVNGLVDCRSGLLRGMRSTASDLHDVHCGCWHATWPWLACMWHWA